MKGSLCFLFVAVFFLWSCESGRKGSPFQHDADEYADSLMFDTLAASETAADIPLPNHADELFDDFFFNFAGNKKMQRNRISFPLVVREGGETRRIERKDWKRETFFMKQGYYTLIFDDESQIEQVKDTTITQVVVENINLNENRVRQYVFNRRAGLWMLDSICYHDLSEAHHASFLKFYNRFVNDTVFQYRSLEERVQFSSPDPDDDFQDIDGEFTAESWPAFCPELPGEILYNIIYRPFSPTARVKSKIFILKGISNGFELRLFFRKDGESWKLHRMEE